jgi:beta-galactosidase
MPHSCNFSRRRFIKSMAAVAAASQTKLALPASLVRPVLANAEACSASRCLDSGWEYYRGALDGPWEVWRGDEIAVWKKVSLPHCFNDYDACDPDTPYYRGHGWYRSRLSIANPIKDGRVLLYFEGAGQTSHVYVGGTMVGSHVGGYDEFVFDITNAVAAAPASKSSVPLAVLCDNSENLERPPSDLSDFSLYGGLYRHVHLAYVPAVSLESVHILPSFVPGAIPDSAATVKVKARLYNPVKFSGSAALIVEIADAAGKTIARTEKSLAAWDGESEIASTTIASLALWSPAHPHLYTCNVTLTTAYGKSVVKERFGIRRAEFVDYGPFKLNGERLLLRGTQRHMDHAGFAAAQPDALIRTEMELVKAMGANFIRLGHYQQSKLVLDLCDEIGLLVWEEAPWCRSGVGDEKWQDQTRLMLANMIDQHFNHPSLIMWGLGNEDDWPGEYPALDQAAICGFMREMNSPTRWTRRASPRCAVAISRATSPMCTRRRSGPAGTAAFTPSMKAHSKDSACRSSASCTLSGAPTAMHAATLKCRSRQRRLRLAQIFLRTLQTRSKTEPGPRCRATAIGPKPTPATSSIGISRCRRLCRGSLDPRSGPSRISPRPCVLKIPCRA